MKIILIIIMLVFSINITNAQLQGQAKIDSLLKELPKMKEDTNGVNLLVQISKELSSTNPDKGLEFGKKGLKLASEIGWEIGIAKSYHYLGSNYTSKSLYNNALDSYFKSLKINEKIGNKIGIADNYNNLGLVFNSQSEYKKSLENISKSLKIYEELNDKLGIAANLNNIAMIYQIQKDYSQALSYYQKALKMNEEINNKGWIAYNLGNIGSIHSIQSNYSKALEYYNKVLPIFKELGNKIGVAGSYGNIGEIYLNQSYDSIIEQSDNKVELLLNKEINLNKAIEYTKESIVIFKELGYKYPQSYFLKQLSQAYELKGDYKKAFETYKKYKTLNDSVFNLDKAKDFATLEAKRESEVKQKEIEILKKEKENEKLQRYVMFGGIAGLGIIIGLILIQRRKSEKLLLNVLPAKIAKRLKSKEHPIADHFDNASIIFIDIVGFTSLSSDADPKRIVSVLNDIFTIFDKLADTYGLEKIKTIGDSYMAVCGIPEINTQHAKQTALMALEIKKIMTNYKTADGTEIHFRIGIDCGPVVAGVIGEKKFIYDLWSDAVNTASRMESTGEKGQIQITENFKEELEKFDGSWKFELRGEFEIKGKGLMKTYYLD